MLSTYVGNTDWDWYNFLRYRPDLDELNFWQPGGKTRFGAIPPGQPFLFRLKSPRNVIAGGGFFAHSSLLPISIAWQAFGEKNGVRSFDEFRNRIAHYKRLSPDTPDDFQIGCIILVQPFFLDEADWIPTPPDFARSIVSGKTYDLESNPGRDLWARVAQTAREPGPMIVANAARPSLADSPMFGDPTLTRRRLGQGAFRVAVTDSYLRRCAISGERTLPVLQAAHIRPVTAGGHHRIDNGVLLRSDIHILFDRGYVTIDKNLVVRVSSRLKRDYDNGRIYYAYEGSKIAVPQESVEHPDLTALEWHSDAVFLP